MFSTPFPRPPAIAPEVSAAPERLQTTVIASRARGGHPYGCITAVVTAPQVPGSLLLIERDHLQRPAARI